MRPDWHKRIALGALVLPLLASGCHRSLPENTPPAIRLPGPPRPDPVVAVKRTTVEQLTFRIDRRLSSSHIATSLDPDGLGARHTRCTCPLEGEVTARLVHRPDGTRTFTIDRVALATTDTARLAYNWTPLIGKISTTIPGGELRITDHEIPGGTALAPDGRFRQDGVHFSVRCQAEIAATGLVLSRQVPDQRADLDITKTTPVSISGTVWREDGRWFLRVPSAVMRDGFDLEGNELELTFTADITAVAE